MPDIDKIIEQLLGDRHLSESATFSTRSYSDQPLIEKGSDLKARMEKHKGRLAMTGGWDRHGEASVYGASEEVVRASAHTAIDEWGADGGLIFWDGGIILSDDENKQKTEWLTDEVVKYGHEVYR